LREQLEINFLSSMVLFCCGFSTYAELLALLIRTFFVCLLDGKYYNLSIQLEGLFFSQFLPCAMCFPSSC
jgi:hypothetical protein